MALLEKNHNKYRALITDINLNGDLVGWDVATRARELSPGLPVIYMTGAAGDQWTSRGVPQSILLTKPFAPAQVVTGVAQLLNSGDRQSPPHNPSLIGSAGGRPTRGRLVWALH